MKKLSLILLSFKIIPAILACAGITTNLTTTSSAAQCLRNNSFSFSTVNYGTAVGNSWNFGDGTAVVTGTRTPSHTYAAAGLYKVVETITNSSGCSDTISTYVRVYPQATRRIAFNTQRQCLKSNNFIFTNTSTIIAPGNMMKWAWDWGDTKTDTAKSPSHTYTTNGIYKVLLTITSANSCTDTISRWVVVNPNATPSFTINNSTQCFRGNSFTYTSTSTVSTGTITNSWTYGDGGTGTGSPVTRSYAAANPYKVLLTVTTNAGCIDTLSKYVRVYPQATRRIAFNTQRQCLKSNNFVFTNTSTIVAPGNMMKWAWDWGDTKTDTAKSPTHVYTSAGTYKVLLTITSANSCTDTISRWVVVNPNATPSFTINNSAQCLRGNSFTYTSASTVSTGTLTNFWNYGDGGTGFGNTATRSYTTAGAYKVLLTVVTNAFCTDTLSKYVRVYPQANRNIAFNTQRQCLKTNSFVFTNTSTVAAPGNMMKWNWAWGDTKTDTAKSPTHVYTTAGTYKVILTITTANSCTDTVSKTIVVGASPTIAYTINNTAQCLRGNSFTFTSTSTVSVGTITNAWNYGDGGTGTGSPVTKSYAAAGIYKVLLTATSGGCVDTLSKYVRVYPQATRNIAFNTQRQCLKTNSFVFTNTSTIVSPGNMMKWAWAWGDTKTDTAKSPTHVYTTAGTYKVILTITTANNCTDTISKWVVVNPNPTVSFTINNSAQCQRGNSFRYTSTSTVTAGTITNAWTYGDGGTGTGSPVTRSYAAAGPYKVLLTATTSGGCVDTLSKYVRVYPQATRNIAFNTQRQCLRTNSFVFTNTSTIVSPGNMMKWSWDWGDTKTDTAKSPTHVYTTAGTYKVILTITTANSCTDTISKTIVVLPRATLGLAVNNLSQCFKNNSFTFTGSNSNGAVTIGTYSWNYGDASAAATGNPKTYSYAAAGVYKVLLTTTSTASCTDTISKYVTVNPNSSASYTVNTRNQCLTGNSYTFTSTSSVSSGTLTNSWNYGDASAAVTGSPVTKSYTAAGLYKVILTTTTNKNCIDTTSQFVRVYPQATRSFTVNNLKQCFKNNNFTTTNSSTIVSPGNMLKWSWDWGDSKTDTAKSPSHNYTTEGIYKVILTITSANGCKDTISKYFTVLNKLNMGFSINSQNQCLRKNSFTYTSTSTISSGTLTYAWSYGDATFGVGSPVTKSYANPNTYKVLFTATSSQGCTDTLSKFVKVYPQTNLNIAVNNLNQCLKGNLFSLTNNSSTIAPGNPLKWSWDWGDANYDTIKSPTHRYIKEGVYLLRLQTTTANGCIDTISKLLSVFPQTSAAFAINNASQCIKGNAFTFTSLSTIPYGTISYSWNLGDGGPLKTASVVNYSYSWPNKYNITFITQTDKNCKDTVLGLVNLNPQTAPSFTLNQAKQCFKGNSFVLKSTSTISKGLIKTQTWSLGDGYSTNGTSLTYKYNGPGQYNLQLFTTSDSGCRDTALQVVNVYPQTNIDASVDKAVQCFKGNKFGFTDLSSVSSGSISQYTWLFGDGGISTQKNPSYSYANFGIFNVTHITQTNFGCLDTIVKQVTINATPVLNVNVNQKQQCLKNNFFDFSNKTTLAKGKMTQRWFYGDGQMDTSYQANHTYFNDGLFNLMMVSYSSEFCNDTFRTVLDVKPMPVANFSFGSVCEKNNLDFTNLSSIKSGKITAYNWHFGDGKTAYTQNTSHTYNTAKIYPALLIVVSEFGCDDSIIKDVRVDKLPTIKFVYQDTCFGNITKFRSTSQAGAGGIASEIWRFYNGNIVNATTATQKFSTPGNNGFTLYVKNTSNCMDSLSYSVTIENPPVSDFTWDKNCVSRPVDFLDNSYTDFGSITNYYWNIGGLAKANTNNTTYTFQNSGTFPVTLITRNSFGCFDTLTKNIILLPKVLANFSYTPDRQEMLEDVNFKNLSQNATNYEWDFGDNNISNQSDPIHQYPLGGDYKVTLIASNADGCPDTITKPIHLKNKALYWVPNAFTPRKSENLNDKFGLETPLQVHRFTMLIYNRWGEIVFRANDVADRWDGTVNGERVMSDVYSYIITFYDIDGYIFKYNGIVSVLD